MTRARPKRGYAVDVVQRLIETLKEIPSSGKIDARQIMRALSDRFEVDYRTTQRDLERLEKLGYLKCDTQSRPYGWSWCDADAKKTLGMSLNTALALKLAYAHVQPLMPASLSRQLKMLADAAEKSLAASAGRNPFARWPDKVRVLSSGPARKPPDVAPEVHLAVSEALLKNLQLRVRYKSLARGQAAEYVVSPLGMVLKGGIIYVVVSRDDKPAPFTLSLHRILKAEIEHIEVKAPPGWAGLDAHIDAGHFLFPPGPVEEDCQVTLRFDSLFVQGLREMPLSNGQKFEEESELGPDGKPYCLVRARVTVSEEFVRWLLQYGDHVEVVKPDSLRKRMRDIVASLHSRYKTE